MSTNLESAELRLELCAKDYYVLAPEYAAEIICEMKRLRDALTRERGKRYNQRVKDDAIANYCKLWDLINQYAEECGANTSKHLTVKRRKIVSEIESLMFPKG